jgi:hypothetical protein
MQEVLPSDTNVLLEGGMPPLKLLMLLLSSTNSGGVLIRGCHMGRKRTARQARELHYH